MCARAVLSGPPESATTMLPALGSPATLLDSKSSDEKALSAIPRRAMA